MSQLRAEYIKERVGEAKVELARHMVARGLGSRQNLIGTGKDDATDALDRRVEFKTLDCALVSNTPANTQVAVVTRAPTSTQPRRLRAFPLPTERQHDLRP